MKDAGGWDIDGTRISGPRVWLGAVRARLESWRDERFSSRLWDKDAALWPGAPAEEVEARLGWLDLPETMSARIEELRVLADEFRAAPRALVLGMGGSSLAPEVFSRTFPRGPGSPSLHVLDTTHPDTFRTERSRAGEDAALVVSSKSGTTIETLSAYRFFANLPGAARSFIAITDPGTPLESLARERGFRRIVHAPTDVGGRYSALSVFGLVPAALMGVDLGSLLEAARRAARACGPRAEGADNPALVLGAALAEAALAGRDKLTLVASPGIEALPVWIEQLIAESSGKQGRGIVPVVGEPLDDPQGYGNDRLFVSVALGGHGDDPRLETLAKNGHPVIRLEMPSVNDLGGEFFRWEMATAAACAAIGVDPFDQPDVEHAKVRAREAMAEDTKAGSEEALVCAEDERALAGALHAWLGSLLPGDYIAVQAYLAPEADLESVRAALRARTRAAVTTGYGPRFLHSTGQLHKGGPNTGLFLQIVDEPAEDVPVPETSYSFGALIRAQALGDARALREKGRRLLRVDAGRDAARGLDRIASAIQAAGNSSMGAR